MEAKLQKRGLWRVVSGQSKCPTGPGQEEALEKWESAWEMAAGEIASAIDMNQRVHVIGITNDPKKMWEKLAEVHVQKEPGTRFNAYDALFNIRKLPDESLESLIGRVAHAMQLCKSRRPDQFTLAQLDEELEVMTLIRALPEDLKHLTSALLLHKDISKPLLVSALLKEEDNQCHAASQSALAAKASPSSSLSPSSSKPSSPFCQFCNSKTHNTQDCFSYKKAKEDHQEQLKVKWDRFRPKKGKAKLAKTELVDNQELVESAQVALFGGQASITSPSHVANLISHDLDWCADTGASGHMTGHRFWFATYKPYRVAIELADNSVVYSEGIGTVVFHPIVDGKKRLPIPITNVLHVPAIKNNLLSVLYLTTQRGVSVQIESNVMTFRRKRGVLFTATARSKLAYLDGTTESNPSNSNYLSALAASVKSLDLELWHRHLCHLGINGVKRLISSNLVDGLVLTSNTPFPPLCQSCIHGKQHREPFPQKSFTRATEVLGLIHSDVHGPLPVQTPQGHRYWITFIDDKSHFVHVYLMKTKDMALTAFKQYKALVENQTGLKIKALRDDKGGEYSSNDFASLTSTSGIFRQHTAPGTPQQNGVAERFNRTMEERIISMLHDAHLPLSFWGYGVNAFIETHNHCPTTAVLNSTPYEVWFKQKPSIAHLCVFGSTAYVHVPKAKRKHLQSHTVKCIMVGYEAGTKAWLLWDPEKKTVTTSRDVIFDESPHPGNPPHLPPLQTPSTSPQATPPTSGSSLMPCDTGDDEPFPWTSSIPTVQRNVPVLPVAPQLHCSTHAQRPPAQYVTTPPLHQPLRRISQKRLWMKGGEKQQTQQM